MIIGGTQIFTGIYHGPIVAVVTCQSLSPATGTWRLPSESIMICSDSESQTAMSSFSSKSWDADTGSSSLVLGLIQRSKFPDFETCLVGQIYTRSISTDQWSWCTAATILVWPGVFKAWQPLQYYTWAMIWPVGCGNAIHLLTSYSTVGEILLSRGPSEVRPWLGRRSFGKDFTLRSTWSWSHWPYLKI